ncbi:thioredoxin [Gorillibacterium massiliense]|uniref:thioredoxin n=1 Tax=Gorillibacterium massiliense TaxID=1280390 RepID=UPI0004BB6C2A|nr:thioredoxin [Gorillibacterium massiliense]
MNLTAISKDEFLAKVQETDITLVDFSAVWCPPCKALHPILDELSQDLGPAIPIHMIDVDESPDVTSAYGVMSMPTVILFKNGEPVERIIGLRPKSVYQQAIQKLI